MPRLHVRLCAYALLAYPLRQYRGGEYQHRASSRDPERELQRAVKDESSAGVDSHDGERDFRDERGRQVFEKIVPETSEDKSGYFGRQSQAEKHHQDEFRVLGKLAPVRFYPLHAEYLLKNSVQAVVADGVGNYAANTPADDQKKQCQFLAPDDNSERDRGNARKWRKYGRQRGEQDESRHAGCFVSGDIRVHGVGRIAETRLKTGRR